MLFCFALDKPGRSVFVASHRFRIARARLITHNEILADGHGIGVKIKALNRLNDDKSIRLKDTLRTRS